MTEPSSMPPNEVAGKHLAVLGPMYAKLPEIKYFGRNDPHPRGHLPIAERDY
jgi:hypothetical protein